MHVADTVGSGIVDAQIVDDRLIFGGLTGGIVWTSITRSWDFLVEFACPDLRVGGRGAGQGGPGATVWSGLSKTAAAIVLLPALGFVLVPFLVLGVSWLLVRTRPASADKSFPCRNLF